MSDKILPENNASSGGKNLLFQKRIETEIIGTKQLKSDVDEAIDDKGRDIKLDDTTPQAISTTKVFHPVPLKNYATGEVRYDTLHASEAADMVNWKYIK